MNAAEQIGEAIAGTMARVRIGFPWWLRPWMARSVMGIVLGRRIYLREDAVMLNPASLTRLLRHELAHVRQVERLGLIVFLARYLSEFVRNLWRSRSAIAAYLAISFEVEARKAEDSAEQFGL